MKQRDIVMTSRCSGNRSGSLEQELKAELNHACGFTSLNNRLRGRWRNGGAADGTKSGRRDGRRPGRGITRIVKVRMVQRIEHLHAELQFPPLSDREGLDQAEIEIPITGCRVDISTSTLCAGGRQAERLRRVNAASERL